jgi:glycosyltransferase involved in cell wall biosynthesis
MPNAPPIRVILSSGVGRIHIIECGVSLLDAGVDVRVITGWIPSRGMAPVARLAGNLLGRPDLDRRLKARLAGGKLPRSRIRTCGIAEGISQAGLRFADQGFLPYCATNRLTWQLFGFASRRHLRSADIFHVRSGAGQGGAIAAARRRGMKIVADHSIAHPAEMERTLAPICAELGLPFRMGMDSPFWQLVIQDCVDADLVLVNSEYVRESFLTAGFPPAKVRTLYWGVRDDFLGVKRDFAVSRPARLLFTGAFGLRKGAREIARACKILDDRGIAYELLIAGNFSEGRPVVEESRLRGTVRYLGMLLQDELRDYLATSDLYVFPTHAEGSARSAMEAMAAGLPVITTRECGLPLRHGEDGWLVPRGDSPALADSIARLLADQSLRESLGRSAQQRVADHYRWSHYAIKLKDIYHDLLGSAAPG